jgi:glycosyltransferase involved in cell wall biosynthesis
LRTIKFCEHLPDCHWRPIVLAPNARAYPVDGPPAETPAGIEVHRAFALDVARHLSVNGAYFNWMAIPDRWNTWLLGAVPLGLRLIRKYRPAAIWSTYPVPSAHLIGYVLSRLSGIPWIADFRDPMVYEGWPDDPLQLTAHTWIEKLAIRNCQTAVFVTPSAMRLYAERYPVLSESRRTLIPNGFDASDIENLPRVVKPSGTPLFLLHSGLMQVPDRDPTSFFDALAELHRCGEISARNLKQIRERAIDDIVFLEPRIAYRDALSEMLAADGLLLFQGPGCNMQIPAKAYEYLAAKKPIFALADRPGDTWHMLEDAGITSLATLGSAPEIVVGLRDFLAAIRNRKIELPSNEKLSSYSRAARARELAGLLDSVAGTA